MSFPPGTEMFQFPGFASAAYGFSGGSPIAGRGCPIRRSSDQSLLAAPQGLSQRATSFIASWRQGIHQMPLLSSTPTSDNRSHTRRMRRPSAEDGSSDYLQSWASRQRSLRAARIPMPMTSLPADGRPTKGQRRRLADAHHRARQARTCRAAAAGISSPPHDVQGTRPERPPKKGGAGRTGSCRLQAAGSVPGPRGPQAPTRSRQVLVGLGRLERPTSRLSGVRSNQLSYRPEHHPAGPVTRRRGQGHEPRPSPPADPVRRLFAKGRADGGRNDPDGQ